MIYGVLIPFDSETHAEYCMKHLDIGYSIDLVEMDEKTYNKIRIDAKGVEDKE